ncbi:MAG: hypothetical protein JO321_15265 [Solirubrobacterales bacterium]|nr:hypothetical protein [Solirubrobacterales bacterium]
MSESAGLTRGDLSSLGALLALLHRADAAFDSVAATYRFWRHEERASAAWRAQIEEEKLRGAAITSFALHDDSDRPAETEEVLRIWRAGGCVREEREGGPRDGAYAVRDGDAWWAWDNRNGANSNQADLTVGYSVGEEVSLMLDPTPLLGALRFTPTGRGRVAGRETMTADAVPRLRDERRPSPAFELHQLGSGGDRYGLQVDAERGVLLEVVATRDGEPFHRITTERIAFDDPIDPERLRFVPPAGEEVRSAWGQHRLRHVPLTEAQQLAPFTVLVPERIPADWRSRYTFVEPSQRPPHAACVLINYHSDDGHESVSLSEYAAGEQPDQYDLMIKHDEWQTITRNGTDVRARAPGGQAQAYIERDGTFVFVSSDTLTAEQLAGLAAGLKPAPNTSSV